jgi:hypothetical protein
MTRLHPATASVILSVAAEVARQAEQTGMLIDGVYHFRPKPVGFRNDYCIPCGTERVAIQVRTIDVWHVFWIPVIPLGAHRRWWCLECGRSPDLAKTARRSIKILLAVVLGGLAALTWSVSPPSTDSDEMTAVWVMRVVFSGLLLATVWWIGRGSDDVRRRELLRGLAPSQATECPLCKITLQLTDPPQCIKCGIVRMRV